MLDGRIDRLVQRGRSQLDKQLRVLRSCHDRMLCEPDCGCKVVEVMVEPEYLVEFSLTEIEVGLAKVGLGEVLELGKEPGDT